MQHKVYTTHTHTHTHTQIQGEKQKPFYIFTLCLKSSCTYVYTSITLTQSVFLIKQLFHTVYMQLIIGYK